MIDMQMRTRPIASAMLPRSRRLTPGAEVVWEAACIVAWVALMLSNAGAAPPKPSLEDRYIATRDAAIEKFSTISEAGNFDDAATRAQDAARADLLAQMSAILGEAGRGGFGPAKLNLDTFSKGDEGFGMLDGLRFDAEVGKTGEKAGSNGADGKYVEPKAHILVTTQTMLERWLHAHKDWWDKGLKNVPQQIGAALGNESFYTQAIPTDAAVVNFGALPIAKPATATFAHGILAGRTQDDIPNAANEVFVSALANGKVYIAYGSIEPEVRIAACLAIRSGYNKRAEAADEKLQSKTIEQQAYDKLGDLRQQGEDAYKRCFTQRVQQQPSFAMATKQAQSLLAAAMER
jgi:hypothetical protein